MHNHPQTCPICNGALVITRLACPACETAIEGRFAPTQASAAAPFSAEQLRALLPFAGLSPEQLFFLVTFARCEGRLNRMEEELSLSYPTLRGRLDEILHRLGIEPARDEPAAPPVPDAAARQQILDQLNSGAIDVAEAQRRLLGIAAPQPTQQPMEEVK